jgi:hypothetical protein
MLYAIANILGSENSQAAGDDSGNAGNFRVPFAVSATDGPLNGSGTVEVLIPFGTRRSHFNEIIADAIVAFVNAQHSGWSLDAANLYFQPFDNGQ